jgi:hypothetical protein
VPAQFSEQVVYAVVRRLSTGGTTYLIDHACSPQIGTWQESDCVTENDRVYATCIARIRALTYEAGSEGAVSVLTAISVATIFAVFGFPYRFYHCWYSWSHKGAVAGFLIYLILAGGGGGLIGWLPAQLGQFAPSESEWINGLIYGVAGSLAVRADFGTKYSKEPGVARPVASVLGKGIAWSTELLDHILRHQARQYLRDLPDRELLVVTRDLIYEIKARPSSAVSKTAKAAVMKKAVEAMKTFSTDPKPEQRDEARGRLIHFCLEYMVREHVAKPSALMPAGPLPAPTR